MSKKIQNSEKGMQSSDANWVLSYEGFDPKEQPLREALTTLGNGYFATRGAAEEGFAGDVHYPGTYLGGGYNRLESIVAGRPIYNEDLVNFPNWLGLTFKHEGEEQWFRPLAVDILSYRQELDMREGVLKRNMRIRDKQGRETTIVSRRIVHMGQPHLAAIEYCITPENWSGNIEVRSMLDGSVINAGVARYRQLNSKHLELLDMGRVGKDGIFLKVQTNQSHVEMVQAARTRAYSDEVEHPSKLHIHMEGESICKELNLKVKKGQTLTIEKIVTVYTSKDAAISECVEDAKLTVEQAGRFSDLLETNKQAWDYLWHRCDVEIDAPDRQQVILRLHIFHLLQSVSLNSTDLDVGAPARGLHGEAYRGHIFWDDLYIFPFYNYRLPEITRGLLMYRYRRLNAARQLAKDEGFKGAMYPWQSASNGLEETQSVHLNPRTNTWGPDLSRRQRHVNAAIAYNVWQYYQLTGDMSFLSTHGAEMILAISRFWSSITTFNEKRQRYEIHGVMGPDEYHEKYPGSDKPGLSNNAYTNVMVVWIMERALDVLDLLTHERREELVRQLELGEDEVKRWKDITQKMFVPFHDDNIISQFEGYGKLEEFDWEGYTKKYGNIERLDRVLKGEEDSPNRYKVSKQADVLMLFYMLPEEELQRLFTQLGYPFDDDAELRNLEYYKKRTSHGSTLSKIVFTSVLDRIDRNAAKKLFHEALISDVSDIQGGTTQEGIHMGAMAGTVDIVMRHYAGVDATGDLLAFNPNLPNDVHRLRLRIKHRDQWYHVDINDKCFQLTLEKDGAETKELDVSVYGEKVHLTPGTCVDFPLQKTGGTSRAEEAVLSE